MQQTTFSHFSLVVDSTELLVEDFRTLGCSLVVILVVMEFTVSITNLEPTDMLVRGSLSMLNHCGRKITKSIFPFKLPCMNEVLIHVYKLILQF